MQDSRKEDEKRKKLKNGLKYSMEKSNKSQTR